ncbi:MAG: zf-TFIIB domain-containing protein [Phycisphaerae bacterium]|nr:zf-TFIIB domain-containing protein [Phycisphaerae bacterium]
MLYRIARAVAEAFKFVAFGGFVVAFFVAFAFVFILPVVPLFLIISAPFVLVLCWIASDLLGALEQAIARRSLRRGKCPACENGIERFRFDGQEIHECGHCRRIFESDGDIWQRSPDAPPREPADSGHPFRPDGMGDRSELASS